MAFDVLEGVLARAHKLDRVSEYVVTTMRELTGSRAVALFAGHAAGPADDHVLAVSPDRKRALVTADLCATLCHRWREAGSPDCLLVGAIGPRPASETLRPLAQHGITVLPLAGMEGENGAILLFDPPERTEHLADVFAFVKPLQALLGMVLSQSLLVDRQERTIADRTRALARSEAFYRTLFESSPFPFALADPTTGRIQDVNSAFAQLTGRPRGELVGQHHSILHPCDTAKVTDGSVVMFAETRDDPGPPRSEVIVLPDGTRREVEVRACMLPAIDPPALLGFFEDVTEENRLRREERRLQEELYQAQKMEALGALAGGIAHDFNNLLSSIRGFTELTLLDLDDRPREQEQLEFVIRAADRAKELVQQILSFSRRSLGECVVLSVTQVVEEVLGLLRASFATNIKYEFQGAKAPCLVKAHAAQVHQIVMNLCTNAVHAMRPSGGTLSVSVASELVSSATDMEPGEYVRLTIADTGVGMDDATLGRIFEPYFTTKPMGQGTGLGLSVVHGIVKNMRGRILVRSKPNEGTTFVLLLPAATEHATPTVATTQGGLMGKARILVVDDDITITHLAAKMLQPLGHAVTTVSSGRAALALFEHDPHAFDLVITDQIMPEMSGTELLQGLLARRPNLPVILCSGYSENLDEEQTLALGARAYLAKPFSRQQIADAVKQALAGPLEP
jgi:PAS domain S-box-containing protein